MNNNLESTKKIAQLETKLDFVESELGYLNKILIKCGFPEGLKTLKSTVEELLSEGVEIQKEMPPFLDLP